MGHIASYCRKVLRDFVAAMLLSALAGATPLAAAGSITISQISDCIRTRYTITVEGTRIRSIRLDSAENAKITGHDPYPVGDASTVTIEVSPINPATHARAILVVKELDGDVATAVFAYRAEHIDLDKERVAFGYVAPGSSREQGVALTNPDSLPVTIKTFKLESAGGQFSIVAPTELPLTIPGRGTLAVIVRAAPTTPDAVIQGTLEIETCCCAVFRVALEASTLDPAGADNDAHSADGTTLRGAEPNPVRETVRIGFTLARPGRATITLHDELGRLVATLVDEMRAAGEQTISYDASRLPSGVYHYRLSAGEAQLSRSFVRE